MKAVLLAAILTVALPTAAAAHCYSIWRYKTPQRCGVARVAVRAQAAAIEAPPPVKPAPDPAAAPRAASKELDEDAARAAAIQKLREQMRPK